MTIGPAYGGFLRDSSASCHFTQQDDTCEVLPRQRSTGLCRHTHRRSRHCYTDVDTLFEGPPDRSLAMLSW